MIERVLMLNVFFYCIFRADATTTLQRLIDSNLEDYLSKFESVSEAASKEHVFERNLEKMKVREDEAVDCYLFLFYLVLLFFSFFFLNSFWFWMEFYLIYIYCSFPN